MYIDRILYPIETLGPGKRIVLWTAGCSKHCEHCANPELWNTAGKKNVCVNDLAQIIKNLCTNNCVDGITFTGGDPLEQMDELLDLLGRIKPVVTDVLVYTGYELSDLQLLFDKKKIEQLEKLVSVLIDGPYVDERNDDTCTLRGSSNQCIYYFDPSLQATYEKYLLEGRKIQNVVMGDKFISVGIHNRKKDESYEEQSAQVAAGNIQL
jgi:anaerobic ribonucleoside-triphosphate reductase activating protein